MALPSFPWPPPTASSFVVIPLQPFLDVAPSSTRDAKRVRNNTSARLAEVDSGLRVALGLAGHHEMSYYGVPNGFALVTRLESIEANGEPKAGEGRWNVEMAPVSAFSIGAYIRALFSAPLGRYRVIVVLITSQRFTADDVTVSKDDASRWLALGGNSLPTDVAALQAAGAICTAMIYEFEKGASAAQVEMLRPGKIPAKTHVIATGLGKFVR